MTARYRLLFLIAVLVLGALPATASAAVSQRLVAPANGAVLPLGVRPTFVLKDRLDDIPTLEVSASPQTDADGVFTNSVWSAGYISRPDGRSITVTPERSRSPRRFWNKPGTYYWHAYIADCPFTGPRPHTCQQRVITRTRKFTITGARAVQALPRSGADALIIGSAIRILAE